jgi:hypothetical protein
VRRSALEVLRSRFEADDLARLLELFERDPDPGVRNAALEGLGHVASHHPDRASEVERALVGHVDSAPHVDRAIVWRLARMRLPPRPRDGGERRALRQRIEEAVERAEGTNDARLERDARIEVLATFFVLFETQPAEERDVDLVVSLVVREDARWVATASELARYGAVGERLLATLVRSCEPGLFGWSPFRASSASEQPSERALRCSRALVHANADMIASHVVKEPNPIARALLFETIARMSDVPRNARELARFLFEEKDPRVREAGARALRPRD